MAHSVTVTSNTKDGEDVAITIDATGADTGTITAVRSENGSGERKTDLIQLTRVRHLHGQDGITCRARAAGLDLDVRCTLNAPARGRVPSVTLVANAFIVRLLDETYPLEQHEYDDVRTFIANANFPRG